MSCIFFFFLSTSGDSETLPGLGGAISTHCKVVVLVSQKVMLAWYSEKMFPAASGAIPVPTASADAHVQPMGVSRGDVWEKMRQ